MDAKELIDTFEFLGDWEERYRYLIDIGRKLPEMPESEKTAENKVRGCLSQVWLTARLQPGDPPVMRFSGDSDAHIVKGLVALLFKLVDGLTPQEITELDIDGIFDQLGLGNHITVNRRNGFYSMVERIKSMSLALAEGDLAVKQ